MINSVLLKTLKCIHRLLTETRDLNNRYDSQLSIPNQRQRSRGFNIFRSSFDEFDIAVHREEKQKSVTHAVRWAIHDADKFKITVQQMKDFIDGLNDITKSLEIISDQQARMKEEIESVSDRESLQLIRDAAGQEDVADLARQQLQQMYMATGVEGSLSGDVLPNMLPSSVASNTASRSFPLSSHESIPAISTQLFPSSETLFLQHDHDISKGNLALCIATATDQGSGPRVQLFHLKMKDVKRRKFSLRRVSGEEVCSTSRVYRTKVRRRTRLRRSISSSMSSIQSMSSGRRSSVSSQTSASGSSKSLTEFATSTYGHHKTPQSERVGIFVCSCCPKQPMKFDTLHDLR